MPNYNQIQKEEPSPKEKYLSLYSLDSSRGFLVLETWDRIGEGKRVFNVNFMSNRFSKMYKNERPFFFYSFEIKGFFP